MSFPVILLCNCFIFHATALERQIEATDRQIDQLVYQLYGLTDAEIALVEQSSK